jgi:hypothetical protein
MIKSAKLKFDKHVGETPRAYLIRIAGDEHWIPKSLCRAFRTNNQLKGSVELPSFIINRMFDIDINELKELPDYIIPSYIVEHHEPIKVNPVENNTIIRLKK